MAGLHRIAEDHDDPTPEDLDQPTPDDLDQPTPENFDWLTFYNSQEEDVGQNGEQTDWIKLMMSVLDVWAVEQGWSEVFVGSDQFFAWDERNPHKPIAPDVYLLDDPPSRPFPDTFQTWLPGIHAPRVAFEFVSHRWKKDYYEAPPHYDKLGVDELIIFDQPAARQPTLPGLDQDDCGIRQPLQHFTRDRKGALTRTHLGQGPVWSPALNAWLTIVPTHNAPALRLATDPAGRHLVPSHKERAEAERERADAEWERAEAAEFERQREQARAEREQEKAEAEWERAEAAEFERQRERARAEAAELERQRERARAEREQEKAEAAEIERQRERARAEAAELERQRERVRADAERDKAEALAKELAELRARLTKTEREGEP